MQIISDDGARAVTEAKRQRVSTGYVCPHCGGRVYKIRRRAIDRIFSLVLDIRRFRCPSSECAWVGNLRK